MRKKLWLLTASASATFQLFFVRLALGAPLGNNAPVVLTNPLGVSTFSAVVDKVMTFLFQVAVPLTAVMALIGGFQMITSAGNPEKVSSGRKTLMWAAIGFAVVILAGGVVAIITNLLS
jgi:hypothetical protein